MTAPLAPDQLAPAANEDGSASIAPISRDRTATAGSLVGTPPPPSGPPITYSGRSVEADKGDWVTAIAIQVFADSATNATPGTPIINVNRFARSLASADRLDHIWSVAIGSQPLTVGTSYRWRAKTRDKDGVWGAWSSLLTSRFKPNTVPGEPKNRAVDVASLDPNFYGSLDDPDPAAAIATVEIEVFEDTTLGSIQKWASGPESSGGTRFAISYSGSPLVVGSLYRWRARVTDNIGSTGPWSPFDSWRPADTVGPNNMSPIDVETRQTSLTPTLTIGHSAAFDAYELEVAKFPDGSGLLWDVGVTPHASTTSKPVVYAGLPLEWGRTFYWRAKVRVAGTTWTEWSPWFPFYLNAVPDGPVVSIASAVESGTGPFGAYVTTADDTPTLAIPFSDADITRGYDDEPTRQEVEIRVASSSAHVTGSPFIDATTPAESLTVPAATLAFEETYKARARYDDDTGTRSVWGGYLVFKVSEPPVLSAPTVVDDTDPAPEVGWTFTSPGGKAQRRFRVTVIDDTTDDIVHDSGIVESATPSYVVPGEILQDGETYRWEVTAYDTDLLSDDLAGAAWTADFVTPDALTGLTATPDTGDSSVTLAWNVTTLDADHFWRYYIYRLDPTTGDYVRIGEVTDRATPTFIDSDAPHGLVSYRVTVTNGWAESAPASASTTLSLKWWIADPDDPDLRFEVRYVSGFRSHRAHQQDVLEPLGREEPVVVSGSLLAPAGTFAVTLMAEDAAIYGQLVAAAKVSPWVTLKDPFGGIFRVKLGSIDQDRREAGSQLLGVEYRVVAA